MGLENKFKRIVAVAAVMAAAYGCGGCGGRVQGQVEQRYRIMSGNGSYSLVDSSTGQKRAINDGVAATIDDMVKGVENENSSVSRLSNDYRMRVVQDIARSDCHGFWKYFGEQEKKELTTKYLQSLPEDEQIKLLAGPLKEKAASIVDGARAGASKAYKGAAAFFDKAEHDYTELTVAMVRESYGKMRKMIGGGQN